MQSTKIISYFLALLLISSTAAAQSKDQALDLEADSVEYNYKNNSSIYRGNVAAKQGNMQLTGDTVEIFTKDGQATRITVDSDVSIFSDILSGKQFHAEARHIDYDNLSRVIHLRGNVKIDYDSKILYSERAMYDLNRRTIVAPKSSKRVRLRIDPSN